MSGMRNAARPDIIRTPLFRAVCVIILALGFVWLYVAGVGKNAPFVVRQGETIRFTDGAVYFAAARSFWASTTADFYSVESQLRISRELTGSNTDSIMPVNALPTILVVLGPLIAITDGDLPLAQALWMGSSLALLLVAAGRCCVGLRLFDSRRVYPYLLVPLVAIFSYSTKTAVVLGQTTILTSACFLFLIASGLSRREDRMALLQDTLWVFLLSIKPQYFALGWALALFLGRARAAWLGMGLALITWAVLTPKLGFEWVHNYRTTLSLFQGSGATSAFSQGFWLDRMNIFVTAFSESLGQKTAFRVTWTMLALTYAGALAAAWRWRGSAPARHCCAISMLVAYSLFAPHSGFYEEIIWAPILFLTVANARREAGRRPALLIAVFLAALVLNRAALDPNSSAPIVWWFVKLLAGAFAICAAIPSLSAAAVREAKA